MENQKALKTFINVLNVLIFIFCLSFVVLRGNECLTKLLNKPESVKINFKHVSEVSFPAFTFCILPENKGCQGVNPLKIEKLSKCNLSIDEYNQEGVWTGTGSEFCSDPKTLYEEISTSFSDLKLKNEVHVTTFRGETKHLDLKLDDTKYFNWVNHSINEYGTCFSLQILPVLTNLGIHYFSIHGANDLCLYLNIAPKGIFIMDLPGNSVEILWNSEFVEAFIDYEQIEVLHYNNVPCTNDIEYDYLACIQNYTHRVIIRSDIGYYCEKPPNFIFGLKIITKFRKVKYLRLNL